MQPGGRLKGAIRMSAFVALAVSIPAAAKTIGIIVDRAAQQAIVFDADTDTIIGRVPILASPDSLASCSITPDQKLGFVAAGANAVNQIDLASSPPARRRLIYNGFSTWKPEHTAISSDGRFVAAPFGKLLSILYATVGIAGFPFFVEADVDAVEICADNSVLVAMGGTTPSVRRYKLSAFGTLSDTHETLNMAMRHLSCSPNGLTAIGMERDAARVTSFRVSGMLPLYQHAATRSIVLSGLVNSRGDMVFMWGESLGSSPTANVEALAFNSVTGAFQEVSGSVAAAMKNFNHGTHQMALHPTADKLYFAQPPDYSNPNGRVEVLQRDPSLPFYWRRVNSLSGGLPVAVCLPECAIPTIGQVSASPSSLWPPNDAMIPVTIDYQAGCAASCGLTVTSNQMAGVHDGHKSADWEVLDAHHVLLRAEREEHDGDRRYTITITCVGATAHNVTRTVTVSVPHDQGHDREHDRDK